MQLIRIIGIICILGPVNLKPFDIKDPQTLVRIMQEIDQGQLTREKEELYSKHIRALFFQDEYQRINKATLINMFIKMRENIRKELPSITDEEYQQSLCSAGVVLYRRKEEPAAIDIMIRDAYCLSTSAQMMLKFIYEIHPHFRGDVRILCLFKTLAQEGSPHGQFVYGQIILNGMGVEKNIEEGIKYLELASEACITDAHKELAFYYYEQGDEIKFEKYLRRAADEGDVQSIYNLGITEQKRKNYKEAVNYFNKALEQDPNYYHAKLELGRMYIEGWGVPLYEEKGFNLIEEVAQKCDEQELKAIAYLNLGIFYQRGIATKKSLSKAKEYFKKAYDLGLKKADKYLKSFPK